MPLDFPCTSCQRTIRVPDGSEGRKTKCPKCEEIQRVPGASSPAQPKPHSSPAPQTGPIPEPGSATPPKPAAKRDPAEPLTNPGPPPASSANQFGEASYGEQEAPNPYTSPASTADDRAAWSDMGGPATRFDVAQATLKGPAIAMMIVTGFSWLVVMSIVALFLGSGVSPFPEGGDMPGPRGDFTAFWSTVGGGIYSTVIAVVIFAAMSRALQMRNFGFVLTGFILPIIPCTTSYCCVLALPFSIWGIVVLCGDSVKAAFRQP